MGRSHYGEVWRGLGHQRDGRSHFTTFTLKLVSIYFSSPHGGENKDRPVTRKNRPLARHREDANIPNEGSAAGERTDQEV